MCCVSYIRTLLRKKQYSQISATYRWPIAPHTAERSARGCDTCSGRCRWVWPHAAAGRSSPRRSHLGSCWCGHGNARPALPCLPVPQWCHRGGPRTGPARTRSHSAPRIHSHTDRAAGRSLPPSRSPSPGTRLRKVENESLFCYEESKCKWEWELNWWNQHM